MPEAGGAGGGGGKRVAPISSSAFSFSLGTPAKKARGGGDDRTPKPPAPAPKTAPRTGTPATARTATAPLSTQRALSSLSFATPTRGAQGASASSSRSEGRRPVARLEALPSPLLGAGGASDSPVPPARERRRLTSVFEDETSPFRIRGRKERREMQGIYAMPRPAVGDVAASSAAGTEADDGVGVSPRRFKGPIHHRGAGPPPSVRAAALVSSAHTSLVLFYTSLQQTLYPSTSARRPNPCLSHIGTAPIRLIIESVVPGPTHAAVMALCSVQRWHTSSAPRTVMAVFQSLPADCPRLGVDPRVLPDLPDKTFHVGVFAPWSDTTMPSVDADSGGAGADCAQAVLFASRYLVVDVDSPL